MMTWLPPSPPLSDSGDDIYYDCTGEYWFEQLPMAEHRLPSIIYELYRPLPAAPRLPPAPRCMPEIVLPGPIQYQIAPGVLPPIIAMPPSPTGMCTVASGIIRDTVPSPSTSVTSIAQERGINLIPQTGASSGAAYLDTSNLLRPATPSCLPGSVDDAIDSVRKTAQKTIPFQGLQRSQVGSLLDGRNTTSDLRRPFTPPPRYREAIDYDGTEWSIAEEYEALMILTKLQRLPNHLHSTKDGHCVNWDLMSTLLSTWSEVYRSPRQCSLHYQMVVQPREEGRMVTLDPITKKTRRVPLSSSEMIHMKRGRTKTDQQYFADIVQLLSSEFDKKAKALKMASLKQTPHLEMQRLDEAEIKWDLPEAQGMKLTELGVQYDSTTTLLEIINRREENRKNSVKSTTQKNLTFIGDDEETITEEKATLKEPALSTIPGVINYQRISYDDIMQEAQKQPVAVATSLSGTSVSTAKIFSASSQSQSASSASAQSSSDSTPIIFGQRACADHSQSPKLQVTSAATPAATTSATSSATPAAHQISSRRLTVPVGSGSSAQHQIVMTGSTQMGSTGGQQPYAVVVTSHDTLGGQQSSGRFQHAVRQEGMAERQTVYRAIPSLSSKRTISSQIPQRQKVFQIATGTSAESQQQIYAAPSHSGRTLIMSQGDNSHLGEASQIQMIRPQMQTGISLRQDVRPKIAQRTPQGRLYVTTTGADRTYIMPQSQVRMIHGAQRITSKRVTNSLHTKTIGGQAQVAMMLPRGSPLQQIRTISRYQSSRSPSIGFMMSNRSSDTVGGSGTTKQLPSTSVISRQNISGTSSIRSATIGVQGGVSNSSSNTVQDQSLIAPTQRTQSSAQSQQTQASVQSQRTQPVAQSQQTQPSGQNQQTQLSIQSQNMQPSIQCQQTQSDAQDQQMPPSISSQQTLLNVHSEQTQPNNQGQQIQTNAEDRQLHPSAHSLLAQPSIESEQLRSCVPSQQTPTSIQSQQTQSVASAKQTLLGDCGHETQSTLQMQLIVQTHHNAESQPVHPNVSTSQMLRGAQIQPLQPNAQGQQTQQCVQLQQTERSIELKEEQPSTEVLPTESNIQLQKIQLEPNIQSQQMQPTLMVQEKQPNPEIPLVHSSFQPQETQPRPSIQSQQMDQKLQNQDNHSNLEVQQTQSSIQTQRPNIQSLHAQLSVKVLPTESTAQPQQSSKPSVLCEQMQLNFQVQEEQPIIQVPRTKSSFELQHTQPKPSFQSQKMQPCIQTQQTLSPILHEQSKQNFQNQHIQPSAKQEMALQNVKPEQPGPSIHIEQTLLGIHIQQTQPSDHTKHMSPIHSEEAQSTVRSEQTLPFTQTTQTQLVDRSQEIQSCTQSQQLQPSAESEHAKSNVETQQTLLSIQSEHAKSNVETQQTLLSIQSEHAKSNVETQQTLLSIQSEHAKSNVETQQTLLSIQSEHAKSNVETQQTLLSIQSEHAKSNVETQQTLLSIQSEQAKSNVETQQTLLSIQSEHAKSNVETQQTLLSIQSEQAKSSVQSEHTLFNVPALHEQPKIKPEQTQRHVQTQYLQSGVQHDQILQAQRNIRILLDQSFAETHYVTPTVRPEQISNVHIQVEQRDAEIVQTLSGTQASCYAKDQEMQPSVEPQQAEPDDQSQQVRSEVHAQLMVLPNKTPTQHGQLSPLSCHDNDDNSLSGIDNRNVQ